MHLRRDATVGRNALKDHRPLPALDPHSQDQGLRRLRLLELPLQLLLRPATVIVDAPAAAYEKTGRRLVAVALAIIAAATVAVPSPVLLWRQAEVKGERAVVRVVGPDGEQEELWSCLCVDRSVDR